MLLLVFNIGDDSYAISSNVVVEVVPLVNLKSIPMEEDYIAGIFNYHGSFVPVIQLSSLCSKYNNDESLTTRIILCKLHDNRLVGFIADRVTKTLRVEKKDLQPCGINLLEADFLGDAISNKGSIIQLVNINQVLGPALYNRLVATTEAV